MAYKQDVSDKLHKATFVISNGACHLTTFSTPTSVPRATKNVQSWTTSHWHKVNIKRMSTLLNLRPDNTGNIVLIFSRGNRCIRMFHWRGCDHTCCHITVSSNRARWRPNSPASRVFARPFVQAQIKDNTKATRHWPLWGNLPVTGGFPSTGPVTRKLFLFDDVIMHFREQSRPLWCEIWRTASFYTDVLRLFHIDFQAR